MTTALDVSRTATLRRAAVRATLAPSVHNTQPWSFRLSDDVLSIFADRDRQLHVLDPSARQLMISCGCALMNARISVAASGYDAVVERLPDPARSDLVARIVATDRRDVTIDPLVTLDPLAALDPIIDLRQTNRRRFEQDEVPVELLDALGPIAAEHECTLSVIEREEHRQVVAQLSQKADAIENSDPAYRAEVRAWTSVDPRRSDGVAAMAVPHVDGAEQDEIPLRDFDSYGMGQLPSHTHSSHSQCLVMLGSVNDRPIDWLHAGEALERILLEIVKHGYVAGPLTQAVEVPFTRGRLRAELGLTMYPHLLLRIGQAASTPASRRRRLVDVLVEDA